LSRKISLETGRLILRDFEPEDFEAFFATPQGGAYQQFYPEEVTTRDFWQTIFERILETVKAEDRLVYQLAVCLPSGELIGTRGVRIEDRENRQASFGCAIAREYWGNGYAFEAADRLIDFGFSPLPVHRIYAETISENKSARCLAERLGMRLESEFLHQRFFRGRWWNTVIYAILREEWR
jgi:RimJ/RimL family protein N-acetyltransferase